MKGIRLVEVLMARFKELNIEVGDAVGNVIPRIAKIAVKNLSEYKNGKNMKVVPFTKSNIKFKGSHSMRAGNFILLKKIYTDEEMKNILKLDKFVSRLIITFIFGFYSLSTNLRNNPIDKSFGNFGKIEKSYKVKFIARAA